MPKLRVHNFAMSVDGYAAGPDQSEENPLGVGGTALHGWAFATRSARRQHGMHVVISPALLRGGERLFDDPSVVPAGYEVTELVGSGTVAHVRLWRTR